MSTVLLPGVQSHLQLTDHAFDAEFAKITGRHKVAGDVKCLRQVGVKIMLDIFSSVNLLTHRQKVISLHTTLRSKFTKLLLYSSGMPQCILVFDSKVRPARNRVMCSCQGWFSSPGRPGRILGGPLYLPCPVCSDSPMPVGWLYFFLVLFFLFAPTRLASFEPEPAKFLS